MRALPDRRFGTIVADPPWRFRNRASRGAAENHYRTMSSAEIAALPIAQRVRSNAHLYLWTTSTHYFEARKVAKAWGFEFKMELVWVKTTQRGTLHIGLGNYYRHVHELVLFCVKGKRVQRARNLPSVFFAPRQRRHSRKPDLLLELAEKMSPGPRLELFARRKRPGWARWGREAPR